MKTISLSEAKDRLSALVDEAETTHEIVRITKHGHPAAVLMSSDDLDSMRETIRLLSTPGAVERLQQAQAERAAGQTTGGEELRRRYGMA